MKEQINLRNLEDTRLDDEVKSTMQREFPLPENVENAKLEAFAKIRAKQEKQEYANSVAGKTRKVWKNRKVFFRSCTAAAAAAAVFSGVCITNPAFAAQIPLVGHVFEELGQSLGFSGDFSKYAKPLDETNASGENGEADTNKKNTENTESGAEETGKTLYSAAKNGMTVTLSEVYCNDVALYVSMILQTEEKFPETLTMQESGAPVISVMDSTLKFSYNDQEMYCGEYLDGRMVDDYTYAGVLRYDLKYSADNTELPESFSVELSIPRIVGDKPNQEQPEMPEDIRAEYEKAMADNGLSTADEDYENFTEEQKELEHQLFTKMWNSYAERYPDTAKYPNSYTNWWVEGPWNFSIDVTKDHSQTIVKEINDINENNIGLVSVTKTPFELTVEDSGNIDCFTVVLDADGDIMPTGTFGGNANTMPVQDRDVSKVDIYICDYLEYMDELKGYYWSEDYEENKKTKTFRQLLDERALYHKEVSFQE